MDGHKDVHKIDEAAPFPTTRFKRPGTRIGPQRRSTQRRPRATHALLSLPEKTLDLILEYAYGSQDDVPLITSRERPSRPQNPRQDISEASPHQFPGAHITALLVSKLYFRLAVKAYLAKKKIRLDLIVQQASSCRHNIIGQPEGCLLSQYARHLEVHDHSSDGLRLRFPCLQRVTLHVSVAMFDILSPKSPLEFALDRADFARTDVYTSLVMLRGLIDFVAIPVPPSSQNKKSSMWERNVSRLEEIVREEVTKPGKINEDMHDSHNGVIPLYAGSEVCLNSSEMRGKSLPGSQLAMSINKRLGAPFPVPITNGISVEDDSASGIEKDSFVDDAQDQDRVHTYLRRLLVHDPSLLKKVLLDRATIFEATKRFDGQATPENVEDLIDMSVDDAAGTLRWMVRSRKHIRALETEAKTVCQRLDELDRELVRQQKAADEIGPSKSECTDDGSQYSLIAEELTPISAKDYTHTGVQTMIDNDDEALPAGAPVGLKQSSEMIDDRNVLIPSGKAEENLSWNDLDAFQDMTLLHVSDDRSNSLEDWERLTELACEVAITPLLVSGIWMVWMLCHQL